MLALTSTTSKIQSEKSYNNTAFFDKLSCTDYVGFGKCQDRFGRTSWSKNIFRLLGREIGSVQESWNELTSFGTKLDNGRDRPQSAYTTEESAGFCSQRLYQRRNFTPVKVKLLAKDMKEQLKLTHKVVEVVDRPHRKICVTMLLSHFYWLLKTQNVLMISFHFLDCS